MKAILKTIFPLCICFALAFSPSDAYAKKKKLPDVTHDGLERVDSKKGADAVYKLPEADLSGYEKIILLEPQIAFRKYWKQDINASKMVDRVDDDDMEAMISKGKKLFLDAFTKVLNKKGYPVVHTAEGNVLLVRPSIINLDVHAPDPNRTAGVWKEVYTEYAGEATLVIELYDSTSGQILARAIDNKSDIGDNFGWAQPRDQFSNVNDARSAFSSWAKMLARGLDEAKGK